MRKIFLTMMVILGLAMSASAQNRTISGTIVSENGIPLPNVSVTVKGTTIGTFSKENGNYTVSVPATARVLVFSGTDITTQEIAIGDRTSVNVSLTSTSKVLDDVVVTGYTVRKRSEFTGAAAKVDAKQIEQVPIASFEQILQGRAPGLYIASGSGQPGTAARVNIRGVGSIGGSSTPLYILDGIPIEGGVFRSLNPNDFESVDVLKDAAGAGLYGSRGANGVIVITSKKGKAGKVLMQYRGQFGFSEPPTQNNLSLMNTAQRLEYEEKFLGPFGVISTSGNSGYPGWDYSPNNPVYSTLTPAQQASRALLLDSIRQINTNWPDLLFRRGNFKQHELNASGGNQNLTFYSSLSVFQQQGILDRSNLDRYTFRTNVDYKSNRITTSIRSAAGYSVNSNIESESAVALANPVAAAYLELPYRRLNNANGKTNVGAGQTGPNAYDRSRTTTSNSGQFKGSLAVTLQFDIWQGIALKTTNGVDYRNNNANRFIDPTSFVGGLTLGAQGLYNESFVENLQLINTSGIVYNSKFSERHKINLLAMSESIRNKFRTFSATGLGINPLQPNTPAGITPGSPTNNFIPTIGGSKGIDGLSSLFAAGDYTFDKRYTVSASIRRDVTSQAAKAFNDIILASYGVTWNFIREKFMENQKIFQEGRIRASRGESANIDGFASQFGYISTYGSGSYAGVPSIVPTSPGNADLRTESQLLTNIGIDLAMWNRRLRFTADVYRKESRNLFVAQGLSRTTGFTGLNTNAGEMENRGLDFSIDADVVNKRDFQVTLGVNGGFLKNEITSLGQVSEIPQGTSIIRVGIPFGTHYTVGYLGVNPQTGLPVYQDINGNPTTNYSAANNRAAFGSYLPKFTGGASADIRFSGFDISMLFSTAQGVSRFNNESFFYQSTNSNIQFNKDVRLLNSWQKPGDMPGQFQKVSSPRQFSSRDVQDASFVRFRNLQAGYTFNNKRTNSIRGFRIWGQAQNLYTWTKWAGFDPEESNNIANYEFPNPRTYTIGLDINF